MVISANDLCVETEFGPENGTGRLNLTKLCEALRLEGRIVTYALAELDPAAEVGYHIHENDCELYYILSGKGSYNDNGIMMPLEQGDATYTWEGQGHGLKNSGEEMLRFMVLIMERRKHEDNGYCLPPG